MDGVEGPMHTRSDTRPTMGVGLHIPREEEQATDSSPSQLEGLFKTKFRCKFDNTALDLEKRWGRDGLKKFKPCLHVAVDLTKSILDSAGGAHTASGRHV